jgi:hypothetical protein
VKERLQIANCKLQIANCHTANSVPVPVSARRTAFPIFNFQFSIFSFQFLLLLSASLAFASDPPPKGGDSKTGDDYDRELLGDPARSDSKGRPDDAMQKKLQQELGAASQREDKPKDPLLQIAEEMRNVVPRLGKRDSGKVTQYLQQQIVADLDKVIEQAKKAGSKGGKLAAGSRPKGGKTNRPRPKEEVASDQPAAAARNSDSSNRKPEDRKNELDQARVRMMELFRAELPSHAREHVLDEQSECFLPEYEAEIEDYFRRLSKTQPDVGRR